MNYTKQLKSIQESMEDMMERKQSRNAGLILLAAGVSIALVPVVRYLIRRFRASGNVETQPTGPRKGLFSAYRGHHKPHHRKVAHNGVH